MVLRSSAGVGILGGGNHDSIAVPQLQLELADSHGVPAGEGG